MKLPPAGGGTTAPKQMVHVRDTAVLAATRPGPARAAGPLVTRQAVRDVPGQTASELAAPERTTSVQAAQAGAPAAAGLTQIRPPAADVARRAARVTVVTAVRPAAGRIAVGAALRLVTAALRAAPVAVRATIAPVGAGLAAVRARVGAVRATIAPVGAGLAAVRATIGAVRATVAAMRIATDSVGIGGALRAVTAVDRAAGPHGADQARAAMAGLSAVLAVPTLPVVAAQLAAATTATAKPVGSADQLMVRLVSKLLS